jgi:hypothetical protein
MKTAWLWVAAAAAWLAGPVFGFGCSPDLYEERPYSTYVCDVAPASGGGFLVLSQESKTATYRGTCVDRVTCDFWYSAFSLAKLDENGIQLWKTTIQEDAPKIDGHDVACGRVDDIDGRIVVTGWLSLDRKGNRLWIVGLDEGGERLWEQREESIAPGYKVFYVYPSNAPWKTIVTQNPDTSVTVSGLFMEREEVAGLYALELGSGGEIRDLRTVRIEGWPWDEDIVVEDLEPVLDGGHAILVSLWNTYDRMEGAAAAGIDDGGSLVWIRYLYSRDGFGGDPVGIRQAADGSFVFTLGHYGDTTLIWLDPEGRLTETSSWDQENVDLEAAPDGSILLAGESPGPDDDALLEVSLISAERGGLASWQKTFSFDLGPYFNCSTTFGLTPAAGGGAVLVVDGGPILRIGPDGEMLWSIDGPPGCE